MSKIWYMAWNYLVPFQVRGLWSDLHYIQSFIHSLMVASCTAATTALGHTVSKAFLHRCRWTHWWKQGFHTQAPLDTLEARLPYTGSIGHSNGSKLPYTGAVRHTEGSKASVHRGDNGHTDGSKAAVHRHHLTTIIRNAGEEFCPRTWLRWTELGFKITSLQSSLQDWRHTPLSPQYLLNALKPLVFKTCYLYFSSLYLCIKHALRNLPQTYYTGIFELAIISLILWKC